jgi:hypothetical protein
MSKDFRNSLITPVAVTRFETETFLHTHPSFLVCQSNSEKLQRWVNDKYGAKDRNGNFDQESTDPAIYNADTFNEAYSALEDLPRGDPNRLIHANREGFNKLSAAEVADMARLNGRPVYENGRITGYDWNPEFQHMAPVDLGPQITKGQMRWPQDFGKKYSKHDIATWPADRFKEYLQSRGEWGKFELPEDLR